MLQARQPVERLLSNPATDPDLARRLTLSQQARDFASAQLQLPENRSYRLYADLERPFVVWNVFATPEFSLDPELHCFPIAGCVAYRGYYQQGRARGAAALLRQQGLDTYIGGVEAYSTLGWFDDPLLNTMLRWSDERFIAVIFHELAHQQYYLPGDTAFNESFATFVEREGCVSGTRPVVKRRRPATSASASSSSNWCWPAASVCVSSMPAICQKKPCAPPSKPSSSACAATTAPCASANGVARGVMTPGSKAR